MADIEKQQDRLIQDGLNAIYQEIEIPDPSASWIKVKAQLDQRKKRKNRRLRLQFVAGIIAASLIIEFSLNTGGMPKTYASFSSFFLKAKENIVEIFFKEPTSKQDPSKAKTNPPPEVSTVTPAHPENTTIEDATNKLAFNLLLPGAMPDGFQLDSVRIFKEADQSYKNVFLEYADQSGDLIKIDEHLIQSDSTSLRSDIAKDAGTIKETKIKGNKAILVILPDGMINLEWLSKNIKFSVSGKLTEPEALNLGESLS